MDRFRWLGWCLVHVGVLAVLAAGVSGAAGFRNSPMPVSSPMVVSGGDSAPAIVSRIAFAKRSDLFTIRSDGPGLRRLTGGAGDDDDPAWSPDGRSIAFDRTLGGVTSVYVVTATGGAPRLLLRGARSPSWSADGRRLSVVRSGPTCRRYCPKAHDLWIVPVAAGKPRLALAGAWSGDWSPSGAVLAAMRNDGIWTVNIATGKSHHLSNLSGNFGATLDWSPDGTRLLFAPTDGSLITVSTRDGAINYLLPVPSPPPADDTQHCSLLIVSPRWSPDGRLLAYEQDASCHPDDASPTYLASIEIFDADGFFQDQIDDRYWGINPYDIGTTYPVWSPDSRSLAFVDNEEWNWGNTFLATATLTRNDRLGAYRRLTPGVLTTPAWQPRPQSH